LLASFYVLIHFRFSGVRNLRLKQQKLERGQGDGDSVDDDQDGFDEETMMDMLAQRQQINKSSATYEQMNKLALQAATKEQEALILTDQVAELTTQLQQQKALVESMKKESILKKMVAIGKQQDSTNTSLNQAVVDLKEAAKADQVSFVA
jgi:hypothetical protein